MNNMRNVGERHGDETYVEPWKKVAGDEKRQLPAHSLVRAYAILGDKGNKKKIDRFLQTCLMNSYMVIYNHALLTAYKHI